MTQQILNAIFIGSIYALFAVGYTLVFGVLDVLNLAHSAERGVGGRSSTRTISDTPGQPVPVNQGGY